MSASEQSDRGARGLRILVVEDETMVALLLEDLLTDLGYTVIGPVAWVRKAVEMAQHESLDLAILDVNLNGEEVYPVADALAARGVPFVFSTGYGGGSLRPDYRNRPTLSKPFLRRQLLGVLAQACPPKPG